MGNYGKSYNRYVSKLFKFRVCSAPFWSLRSEKNFQELIYFTSMTRYLLVLQKRAGSVMCSS